MSEWEQRRAIQAHYTNGPLRSSCETTLDQGIAAAIQIPLSSPVHTYNDSYHAWIEDPRWLAEVKQILLRRSLERLSEGLSRDHIKPYLDIIMSSQPHRPIKSWWHRLWNPE